MSCSHPRSSSSNLLLVLFAFLSMYLERGNSFQLVHLTTRSSRFTSKTAMTTLHSKSNSNSREGWTYNPFDVNDLSPLDTLLRRGIVPVGVRVFRPQKYEDAVLNFMEKENCDRATAQRNMDAYFNDPNGWIVQYNRKRELNEIIDYNAPTGVQKRPIFSFVWGSFCCWLFFIFFPTRIAELGGIQPTYLQEGGMCKYPIKTGVNGKLMCPDDDNTFDTYGKKYLDKQLGTVL